MKLLQRWVKTTTEYLGQVLEALFLGLKGWELYLVKLEGGLEHDFLIFPKKWDDEPI
jgi:hypothetical protein